MREGEEGVQGALRRGGARVGVGVGAWEEGLRERVAVQAEGDEAREAGCRDESVERGEVGVGEVETKHRRKGGRKGVEGRQGLAPQRDLLGTVVSRADQGGGKRGRRRDGAGVEAEGVADKRRRGQHPAQSANPHKLLGKAAPPASSLTSL